MRRAALPLLAAAALMGCVSDTDSESEPEDDIEVATEALEMSSASALSWALTPTAPVGTIAAEFKVDAMGAASYSIPIQVPPGFGGVEPKLSLVYSSSGGNGLAGVGFNVSGLSKITRCARTVAQDGVRGAVKGDADDRFCLDGQRLVAVSGAYGANATEYRTEMESWNRITSVGDCNTGVCSFTVESKDGTKTLFGESADSRTLLESGRVRTWGVSKVTSANGHYMIFFYQSFGDGEAYPHAVTYTRHGDAPGARDRFIKLEYQDRPDIETGYLNGTKWQTTKRLHAINTFVQAAPDALVRSYKLSYAVSPSTSRSLLSKVEECDAAGVCLPPTTFKWPTEAGVDFAVTHPAGGHYQHDLRFNLGASIIPGDFDGDGYTDFIRQEKGVWDDDGDATFKVYYSNGTDDGTFTIIEPENSGINNYDIDMRADDVVTLIPGDFDGDGRTDFIRQSWWNGVVNGVGHFRVYYATATRGVFNMFQPAIATHQYALIPWGAFIQPVDHDGDGKTDFIRQEHGDWDNDDSHTFGVYLAQAADGVFDVREPNDSWLQTMLRWDDGARMIPGDFNGDGKTDFIRQEHGDWDNNDDNTFSVHFSRGDGYFDFVRPAGGEYQRNLRYDPGAQIIPGDFNGDGKTDFIRQEKGDWDNDGDLTFQVYFSRGNGYFDIVTPPGYAYQEMLRADIAYLFPVDYNGDGKTDFLRQEHAEWAYDTVGTFQIYVSNGDGTFRVESPAAYEFVDLLRADPGCRIIPGDYNGDGKDDFIRQDTGYWADDDVNSFRVYYANGPKGADLLTGFVEGHGAATTIEYGPLTDESLHANGDEPLPEYVSRVRRPLYVVKKYEQRDRADQASPNNPVDTFRHELSYAGAQMDRRGRGFRGFSAITGKDLGTGAVTLTRYHQDFPRSGAVKERVVSFPDGETVTTKYTYIDVATEPGVVQVLPTREEVTRAKGGASYTTATEYQYGEYGNQGLVRHLGLVDSADDDYDTCTTFYNDAAAWRLGYPTNITDDRSCTLAASGDCDCGPAGDATFLAGEHRDYFTAGGRMNLGGSWRFNSTLQDWEKTYFEYDALGRVTKRTDPSGAWENITYDPTDPGLKKTVEQCGAGVVCRSRSFAFDPRFGEEAAHTDENGVLTTRSFDGLGRVSSAWGLRDGWVQLSAHGYYNDSGTQVRESIRRTGWEANAPWTVQREILDGFGRTVTRVSGAPAGAHVVEDIDYHAASGLVIWESMPHDAGDAAPRGVSRVVDAQGRPTRIDDPAGLRTCSFYSIDRTCAGCVGKVVTVEIASADPCPGYPEPAGPAQWTRWVDAGGRVLKQLDPDDRVLQFSYDVLGRRTQVIETGSCNGGCPPITTTIAYDSIGHVLATSSPDRGAFLSGYDTRGLLASTLDARGQEIRFHYDGLGRLTKKEVVNKEDVVYEYEQSGHLYGMGRLTTVSVMPPGEPVPGAPKSRYKFSYTQDGQPSAVIAYIDGVSYALESTFDPLGRVRTMTHGGDYRIEKTYDVLGNLTGVKAQDLAHPDRLMPAATLSEYTAAGQPGKVDYANYATASDGTAGSAVTDHTVTAYTYLPSGQLDTLIAARSSSPANKVLSYDYQWSPAGRLAQIIDNRDAARTQTFGYSEGGHLTSAAGAYGSSEYGYDAYGRLHMPGSASADYGGALESWDPSPPLSHRLWRTSAGNGATTYDYDAAGNRVTKNDGAAIWTYEYDGENRLERVYKKVGGQAEKLVSTFTYTFSGDRATKTDESGAKTVYLGPEVEVTFLPNGKRLDTVYLSGPAGRIAAITREIPAQGALLLPFHDRLLEMRLYDPRSFAGLVAIAATCVSAWRLHPHAPLHAALGASLLLALALYGLAGRARVRRALAATAGLYRRAWLSRFDTRFVRQHRLYALVVPVLVASLLAGCQPAPRHGGAEDVGSAGSALDAGPNGAGVPVVGANYFLQNHIGSASVVTSSDGAVVARVEYTPFGAVHAMAGDGQDVFRSKFTGKEWDNDSGLYYFNARYYDPSTGQFLSPDSRLHGGPESLTASVNPYAYAGNNPVVYTDPSGHDFGLSLLIAAVVIGAVTGAYAGAAAANGTYDCSKWEAGTRTWVGLAVGGTVGAVTGGLGAMGGGLTAAVAIGVVEGITSAGLGCMSDKGCSANDFLTAAALGAVSGGAGHLAGKAASSAARAGFTRKTGAYLARGDRLLGRWGAAQKLAEITAEAAAKNAVDQVGQVMMDLDFDNDRGVVQAPRGEYTAQATLAGFSGGSGGGGASGRAQRSPADVTGGGQGVDHMGQALIRQNMGREPVVPLVAPVQGNDSRTWMAAAAAR